MKIYAKSDYRYDIQGLRGISAILICIYHIWTNKVSGGVDVFFVIAGFFMAIKFAEGFSSSRKISLIEIIIHYYEGIFLRTFIILTITLCLIIFWFPDLLWLRLANEFIASLINLQNVYQMIKNVDYNAAQDAFSPFRHFWALSIQLQFLFIWVLIFIFTKLLFNINKRTVTIVLLAMICFSFLSSIFFSDNAVAYFSTVHRFWQYGLGLMIGLYYAELERLNTVAIKIAPLGLLAFLLFGFFITAEDHLPGWLSVIPSLSAVVILIAKPNKTPYSLANFLSAKYFARAGKYSFGVYLIHWPLLIFYRELAHKTSLTLLEGVLIIILSFFLSYLLERTLQASKAINLNHLECLKTGRIMVGIILILLIGGGYFRSHSAQLESYYSKMFNENIFPKTLYANALQQSDLKTLNLLAWRAKLLKPQPQIDGYFQSVTESSLKIGEYGNKASSQTIVLAGDSHSLQWFPLFEIFAKYHKKKLLVITKAACDLSDKEPRDLSCIEWRSNFWEFIGNNKPDTLITVVTYRGSPQKPEHYRIGLKAKINFLANQGIKIIGVRDNPEFLQNIPECTMIAYPEIDLCSSPKSKAYSFQDSISFKRKNLYFFLDSSKYLCSDGTCKPFYNNTIIYRDRNHLSVDFVNIIAPYIMQELIQL